MSKSDRLYSPINYNPQDTVHTETVDKFKNAVSNFLKKQPTVTFGGLITSLYEDKNFGKERTDRYFDMLKQAWNEVSNNKVTEQEAISLYKEFFVNEDVISEFSEVTNIKKVKGSAKQKNEIEISFFELIFNEFKFCCRFILKDNNVSVSGFLDIILSIVIFFILWIILKDFIFIDRNKYEFADWSIKCFFASVILYLVFQISIYFKEVKKIKTKFLLPNFIYKDSKNKVSFVVQFFLRTLIAIIGFGIFFSIFMIALFGLPVAIIVILLYFILKEVKKNLLNKKN